MTRDYDSADRRTVLKALGAAGAAATLPSTAAGSEAHPKLSDELDPTSSLPQEAIVVFDDADAVDRLDALDLEWYHVFEAFHVAWTELTGDQLLEVAEWEGVRRVVDNYAVSLENRDSQIDTNAEAVWNGEAEGTDVGYTGENVHAALVDTGIDAKHPDLATNVEANYKWVGNPTSESQGLWEDVGPANTDDFGHGTHCAGSLGGTGDGTVDRDGLVDRDGHYGGMAPDVSITSYEVFDEGILTGATAVKILAAYDDLVRKQRAGEHDVQIASNSWGSGPGDFDPWDPIAVAQWYAYREGILVMFSAGNDGYEDDEYGRNDTLGVRKQAPYVMNVAATDADQAVVDFSSRGDVDGNFDREAALENVEDVYRGVETEDLDRPIELNRPGVAAKGALVTSAQSPEQVLYSLAVASYGTDAQTPTEPYYVPLSGTSMACPTAAGVVALFLDAYYEEHGEFPDPIDTITTMEATADPAADDGYAITNAGAGYVDALAAVERAVEGELADFEEADDIPLPVGESSFESSPESDAEYGIPVDEVIESELDS